MPTQTIFQVDDFLLRVTSLVKFESLNQTSQLQVILLIRSTISHIPNASY